MGTEMFNEHMQKLKECFEREGFEVRLVGGAVRDYLQNKTPKDMDFATNATPQEMQSLFAKYGLKYFNTGVEHGTLIVVLDQPYEITTLRVDRETDGRWASVDWTRSWELDAQRRDLTFNAMSMDFNGQLYDYFNGYEDLKNGYVRFVGDAGERLEEDQLRMLRYFRFASHTLRPDQELSSDYDETFYKNVYTFLNTVSGERVWQEMQKLLVGKAVLPVLEKMNDVGLFDALGLKVYGFKNAERLAKLNDPVLVLSTLVRSPETVSFWNLDNKSYKKLEFLTTSWELDTLHDCKRLVFNKKKTVPKEWVVYYLYKLNYTSMAEELNEWSLPEFPVNGRDLLELGYKPGPEMGYMLDYMSKVWLDSEFALNREQLLERVMQNVD